jgi:hypothetical protein
MVPVVRVGGAANRDRWRVGTVQYESANAQAPPILFYMGTMQTTEKPSLYGLALTEQETQSRIAALAELLESDDADEQANAIKALEAELLAEEHVREALNAKADAYCWVVDQLRGQAAWRKEQSRRLAELAAADEAKAERLQNTLVRVLSALQPDSTSFELPSHRISSRRSTVAECQDSEQEPLDLPEQFVRVKHTYSADKTAIKEALKAGQEVPGWGLVERRSWRIG